jgi:hypothetical protein
MEWWLVNCFDRETRFKWSEPFPTPNWKVKSHSMLGNSLLDGGWQVEASSKVYTPNWYLYHVLSSLDIRLLRGKPLRRCIETSGTTHWVTRRHIPEEWRYELRHCVNIKTHALIGTFCNIKDCLYVAHIVYLCVLIGSDNRMPLFCIQRYRLGWSLR